MTWYGKLLAVNERVTLNFFYLELVEAANRQIDEACALYVASIFAHYAQVSTCSSDQMPAPNSLSEVFDHFVANTDVRRDAEMMEIAGSYSLLLTGFFRNQMKSRHNINWHCDRGADFFLKASYLQETCSPGRSRMLKIIGKDFRPLSEICFVLGKKLIRNSDDQYLIRISKES